MRTIKIFFFILLLFLNFSILAQEKETDKLKIEVNGIVRDHILKKLKDSVAVYTFCLKVTVTKKAGGFSEISTDINNPEISKIFTEIALLKNVNYSDFLKFHKKKNKMLFRFYLVTWSSKYAPQTMPVDEVPKATQYIITDPESDFIDLGVFTLIIDQKVYD